MSEHVAHHSVEQIALQLQRIPCAQFFGFSLIGDGSDIIGRMAFSDHLIGNTAVNALHGGALAALLEFTATCKLLSLSAELQLPKIITISVDYLRGGKALDTYARARVTKRGRRVANVHVIAYQDDVSKPIAMANSHFLLGEQ